MIHDYWGGQRRKGGFAGVKIITSTKSCMSACVILCAYMCALVLFTHICVLAGVNANPSVRLIGGCGAPLLEPRALDGRRAHCCIHAHNASYKSIMEGKTMAREVISVQPHPPGSNCAARHVKENQRLCEETVKPWEHCGSDNFNW